MTSTLRLVDSGLRSARRNLSLTEALCRLHGKGKTPDTLRFQHFPPAAIIGRHQILHREVDLDWVRANGVETARRMTGGGAIVMGPGILGWELVVGRDKVPDTLSMVSATICQGVAEGLQRLGVDAAYRPRNDIEVHGRKISGTGGYFDGNTLVFQGTVMMELNHALLTQALRLPAHKLGRRGLSTLSERVGDLKGFLGASPALTRVKALLAEGIADALGMQPVWGQLTLPERRAARHIHTTEIGTDDFVNGANDHLPEEGLTLTVTRPTAGGMLEIAVKLLDGQADRTDQVLISGDFFVSPPRVMADLEAHLRHRPLEALESEAMTFLKRRKATFLGMEVADIGLAFKRIAEKAQEVDT
jgi:lipoate-protein ligase A